MSETESNRKRITKNTAMLYIRMILSMVVSLFTSRVVLATLGVEDLGIYGVVGGVVSMLSFLNSSMSGATSRFLSFEIGKGDSSRLKDTFSSAMLVHIFIAIALLLIAETVGLWFVEYKLVIPEDRMFAARCVYQMSILSAIVGITQVPYNASLIAHERMDIYAYVEIGNVFLRLLIVYLLTIGDMDKLVLFGILNLCVSVLVAMIYRIYSIRNFSECRFHFIWKPSILKPMLKFSGWDTYGNMSVMLRTQGVAMLLNMFFGPVLNAAAGIAGQVQAAVMAFASNVFTAARPQIIKQYAMNNYTEMFSIMRIIIRLNFLLLSLFSIPIIVEADFVLHIWLGIVPEYTAIFCIYTLLFNIFASISTVLVTGIHATGDIRRPSFINGSLYLLVVPVSYLLFKMGFAPWSSYLFNVVAVMIGMLSNAYTLKLYINGFSFRRFFFSDFLQCFLIFVFTFILVDLYKFVMQDGWLRLVVVGATSSIILLFLGYYVLCPRSYRVKCVQFVKKKLCKKA